MTPFMMAVAEAYEGIGAAGDPRTVQSQPRRTGTGTDRQVAVRSLAEQLVCEANVVLAEWGTRVDLEDRPGAGELAFSLRVDGREAQVVTRYADGVTRGRLVWAGVRDVDGRARELAGPDDVGDLILRLLCATTSDAHAATRQGGN